MTKTKTQRKKDYTALLSEDNKNLYATFLLDSLSYSAMGFFAYYLKFVDE